MIAKKLFMIRIPVGKPSRRGWRWQRYLLLLLGFCCLSALAVRSPVRLEHVALHPADTASLERGADFFAKHCLACHSLKYLTYNSIAKKAGIAGVKMPVKDQQWWFGAAPPDLSLIVRAQGADWVYTYLLSFYRDAASGKSDNLLVPNVSMPNPFLGLQGEQKLTIDKERLLTHGFPDDATYYNLLELVKQGTMTPDEFDHTLADLVNFLAYAGEPIRHEREQMGVWVLLFLVIFAILAYFLQREYWQDIKKARHKRAKSAQ